MKRGNKIVDVVGGKYLNFIRDRKRKGLKNKQLKSLHKIGPR